MRVQALEIIASNIYRPGWLRDSLRNLFSTFVQRANLAHMTLSTTEEAIVLQRDLLFQTLHIFVDQAILLFGATKAVTGNGTLRRITKRRITWQPRRTKDKRLVSRFGY